MFFKSLQLMTAGFGFCCVTLSFFLFVHFVNSKKPIGKAVAFMLLGESIGGAATVVFAIAAEGILDVITPISAMALRWVMFSAAAISSIHLAYQTWKIETGQGE